MVLFCVLEGGKECGLKRHMADTVKMLLNQEKIDWLIGRVGQRRNEGSEKMNNNITNLVNAHQEIIVHDLVLDLK